MDATKLTDESFMNQPGKNKGEELFNFIESIYDINRSITGNGVRQTLNAIKKLVPIEIKEVPTGTKVFDWEVPPEWNVDEAYIEDSHGKRIIDFHNHNLHLVSYSIPVNKTVTLEELKKHLFSLPDHPDWIPYRTSYYKRDWGFCVTHNQLKQMKDNEYKVVIKSSLEKGSLTYGEFFIKGKSDREVLFSTHICHPSMCNDNLSGIAVMAYLANYLISLLNSDTEKFNYSYRFLFIPATIGAITWLAQNEANVEKIKHGIVMSLLGDNGNFTYKKSRIGNSATDKIVQLVLEESTDEYNLLEFTPYGYDERQFCSPGFNLPVGRLTRTPNGEFPEYHTSADNLDFISADKLNESLEIVKKIIHVIERNKKFLNLNPKCEPQLGKRGMYNSVAGNIKEYELALLWVLNMSDGEYDLTDIALKSKIPFETILKAATDLQKVNLLEEIK